MSTVVLNAQSIAYPSITNRIQASIYLSSSPLALVASIIDSTAGHPSRYWSFPGLIRDNYIFSLEEIDGSGNPVSNLALFSCTPAQLDGYLVRDDEEIIVDVTDGLNAGDTEFVFDGTTGKPDYRTWDFAIFEYGGRSPMVKHSDYSWDTTTGTFILTNAGDVFVTGQIYKVIFVPQVNNAGGSTPSVNDFTTKLITTDYSILNSDFGSNLIVEPSGNYLELTLPNISTVANGRPLSIEVSPSGISSLKCVKILVHGSDNIIFPIPNQSIYLNSGESLEMYKVTISTYSQWRVRRLFGNMLRCGEFESEDNVQSGVFSKQLLDGSIGTIDKMARLYNNYILNLPISQVCDFDSWSVGNNKYLFSKSNSTNPSNAGKFMFPDRRDLFERNINSSGKSGDFFNDQLKTHDHTTHGKGGIYGSGLPLFLGRSSNKRYSGGGGDNFGGGGSPDSEMRTGDSSGGSETYPKHILVNRYIIL